MSRPAPLSYDNLLRFLGLTKSPASLVEIEKGLGLKKQERRALLRMLAKLKKKKTIKEYPGGRFELVEKRAATAPEARRTEKPAMRANALSGRLILHHDGYGFVVPDTPLQHIDRDIFIPRDATGDAMHGDHVQVDLGRVAPGTDGQRAEGRIVRILDRAHATVVGLFRYQGNGNTVLPYDARIQHQVEIPAGDEL